MVHFSDFFDMFDETHKHLGDVITYHLFIETALQAILEEKHKHEDICKLTFAKKTQRCRDEKLVNEGLCNLIFKMNSLRNKYAHRIGFRTNSEDIHYLIKLAAKAGVDFSDSLERLSLSQIEKMGYDLTEMMNSLFRNTFYELLYSQGEKFVERFLN